MNPVLIIAIIVISIIVATVFVVFFVQSIQQDNPKVAIDEESRDEIAWQLLQKTYLDQECKDKYRGQSDEMQKCFDRVTEEQRLNPPIKPQESNFEPVCSIQCLVYDPVCGKDGITYACGVEDAACHGIEIKHKGECIVSTSP